MTNVTLGATDDVFTYIVRQPPETQLMAMVVDANGRFGQGTPLALTSGSKDTTCTGLTSSSSTTEQIAKDSASRAAKAKAAHKKKQTALAVGLTIVFLVLFALAAVAFWWMRRRRARGEPLFNFRSDAERSITPAVLIPSAPPSQTDLHGHAQHSASRDQRESDREPRLGQSRAKTGDIMSRLVSWFS